jgi:hypothetical protein
MDLEELRHNLSGECEYFTPGFMAPVLRALGLRDKDSVSPLVLSYMEGSRPAAKRGATNDG